MKKLIVFLSVLLILIIGIIEYVDYEKTKSIEICQKTNDEKSLIACFEYPLQTLNEKMMIINHKNFKFSELKNFNSYIHFIGIIMGEYGECNMTPNCKN